MKAAIIDGVPDLPGLVAVSVYDTNTVHFLSIYRNAIKWVQKTRLMYDPDTKMVCDAQFLRLNINNSYDYNMTRLTSVINFEMCTKLITGCISTSGCGLFYFGAMD